MPCCSEKGVSVCGGFKNQKYHFFGPTNKAVLWLESLWYDPTWLIGRKRGERLDRFKKRVQKKLGFMPRTYESWRRGVEMPLMREMMADLKRRDRCRKSKN